MYAQWSDMQIVTYISRKACFHIIKPLPVSVWVCFLETGQVRGVGLVTTDDSLQALT